MAHIVQLPSQIPRDPKVVREAFDVGHLLRPRAIFGWLFLVSGGFFLFAVLVTIAIDPSKITKPPTPAMLVFSFLYFALGWLLVWTVRRKKRTRLRALTHGTLEEARIVDHSTRVGLAILIRRLDTVVRFEVKDGGASYVGSFRSPMPDVRKRFRVGTSAQVMLDRETGAMLMPSEMGKTIELD